MTHHSIPIRVYYEDTDAGGIVYHGSYLRFAERGRTELLRAAGFSNHNLAQDLRLLFVMRHMDINYFKPAVLDDLLELRTSIETMKGSSFVMKQTFFRQKEGIEQKIAEILATLVTVDANIIKPKPLPDAVRQAFSNYIEE